MLITNFALKSALLNIAADIDIGSLNIKQHNTHMTYSIKHLDSVCHPMSHL